MATAVDSISPTSSQVDITALVELQARFAATVEITQRTRRERLQIIIEGFHLFQSYGGYSSAAAHEVYASLQISTRMNDARKAAMAITGEFPAREGDTIKSNRMYSRLRTVAGILVELEKDYPAGSEPPAAVDEIINAIEKSGGWRSYGERGDKDPIGPEEDRGSANAANDGAEGDNGDDAEGGTEAASGKAARDDDEIVFDVAGCRTLIQPTGITALPSSTIVAPSPRVAFICGLDENNLSLMPLTGVPVDILKQLQEYRPDPDEHASGPIRALGCVTTALQLFDRLDSSAPVDPEVEPYAGQDMKPSVPGIVFEDGKRFTISSSRQHSSLVVRAALQFPVAAGKQGVSPAHRWMHGKGTSSLIRNFSSAEHRAAYLDPELIAGGSLKIRFKVRPDYVTDRKDFTIDLKPVEDVPGDYWLLGVRDDVRPTSFADFDSDLAAQPDLLKFAAAAGASKSLKKTVKVAVSGAKELSLSLALGVSKKNVIPGCSVTGAPANCEVAAHDFARTVAFGQEIGANGFQLAIEPNGLLLVAFKLNEIGEFEVAIPTLHEGKPDRGLLRRVPR
jgi:hypothetical protein